MEKSCHVYHNVVNIDHCSTTNSAEYSMENANTDLEAEIQTSDIEMYKEDILKDEINIEYSYANLFTDDTSKNKHHAESSYYDLSDNHNEEHDIQTVTKTPPKVKTDDSEYLDHREAYNILNIHPQKINDTENFDRTIEDVYDKTTHITNTSYSDLGLYDHSANN
ncbi:unnamed protein product [Mytilus coruscus]|uniref:Uncharacterized protein n=1 Tax=Mytilus coruscus TaxID=42192 RepID=A0A6J8ATH0_MYTCO|nr:unnamed protein product [Mytilus coruscus]